MSDVAKILALFENCSDPERLRSWIRNGREKGEPRVADAAFRKLVSVLPKEKLGTVEHDFWQTIHAFEHVLSEERGKTTRLARTRQKVARVGEIQTLQDWALSAKEQRFHDAAGAEHARADRGGHRPAARAPVRRRCRLRCKAQAGGGGHRRGCSPRRGDRGMTVRKKGRGFRLPPIVAGEWRGEIVGAPGINFGQVVQPGPPRQSVEFSYIVLPAALIMPNAAFRWPGVIMIMAPTPMKTEFPDAGALFQSDGLPSLSLSLEVTRAQFSDMLPRIEARRFKDFHFAVEEKVKDSWPLRSWGMGLHG
jgi:hypothetical protein